MLQPSLHVVERIGSGFLAVMPRPRPYAEEFVALADLGVTRIVCLLEGYEAERLGLADELQLCAAAGIQFTHFPLVDHQTPSSAGEVSKLACDIYHHCAAGAGVSIHCFAGIGRSGVTAASVLLHAGLGVEDAFAHISRSRGIQVPDTAAQRDWVVQHRELLRVCHLPKEHAADTED